MAAFILDWIGFYFKILINNLKI